MGMHHENLRCRTLQETLSKTLEGSTPTREGLKSLASAQRGRCSPEIATQATRRLLGCYRRGDAEDPEVFTAAVALVLSEYPPEVVYRVTDPRSGIPATSKWLPTIQEVHEACEAAMRPIRDAERHRATLAEMARLRQEKGEERSRRKTYAELCAMYPDVLGPSARVRTEGENWLDRADARGVDDPQLQKRIVDHHDGKLAALKSQYATTPVGDCSSLMRRGE